MQIREALYGSSYIPSLASLNAVDHREVPPLLGAQVAFLMGIPRIDDFAVKYADLLRDIANDPG
ncbi:hypothetical protein [Butyrivibrio sp. MC2013]|uniref:hypothetical protein n=1 Tax=Butyrivibrio sp. MC2013 TaxID=1280686 RepID=UPI0003FB878B|nr:hypothetical protein [Butyrivibrio sp. MC2013]